MDKRLYVAWNHFSRHQFDCAERSKWLDHFLCLVLEQQEFRVPQFFRGMSSVLVEKFLHDINLVSNSTSSDDVYSNQLDYCLHQRGWLLLNALLSSNIKNLAGVASLTQTLTHLYGLGLDRSSDGSTEASPKPNSPALFVVVDSPSWPMSDLATIVSRSDLKSHKSPNARQLKRRKNSVPRDHSRDECCSNEVPEDSSETELPCLAVDSFRHLILSLLELIVGYHGDFDLASGQKLDQTVMAFAQQHLSPETKLPEQRRLLRLILRGMVSTVQHGRALPSDNIVGHLIDVATASHSDISVEVVESLVRFLAAVQPVDDKVNEWLRSFHTQKSLQLIIQISQTHHDVTWCTLIATIISNASGNRIPCHHHQLFGEPLNDPDGMDQRSCSISSLFYFLLQLYSNGDVQAQRVVLKTMVSGGRPCCCLAPELIHKILFSRVVETQDFLDALEITFRSTGFSVPTNPMELACYFCRENGGYDLERCRRAGVYASTESLSSTYRTLPPPDPWKSFDFYSEFILERLDCPFSLKMIQHMERLVNEATAQVKCEIFSRIFYPILSTASGTVLDPASVAGTITEACWKMTADLIRQPSVCELFSSSSGLELLFNFCRSSVWSWNVARVLQSMIIVQFETKEATDPVALTALEHLLVRHTHYIVRCLENQRVDIPELEAAASEASTFESLRMEHLQSPGYHQADGLKTASALWDCAIRLLITNQSFASWFKRHAFVRWIVQILPAVSRHLSDADAIYWDIFAELMEIFIAGTLLSHQLDLDAVLKYFSPGKKLGVVHEMLLRCSTLERWTRKNDFEENDEDLKLFFPDLMSKLIKNFADWDSKIKDEEKPVYYREYNPVIRKMERICCNLESAALLASRGFLADWIQCLKPVVVRTDPLSSAIRKRMMNVVLNVGKFRITSGELELFVDVMKEERGIDCDAMEVLLDLLRLSGNGPSHFLSFPLRKSVEKEGSIHLSSGSINYVMDDVRSDFVGQAKLAMELGRLHESRGIPSAWRSSAIFINVPSDQSWNWQNDGASLSMWLNLPHNPRRKLDKSSEKDPDWRPELQDYTTSYPWNVSENETPGDVHLFSIGTKNLLVEFWVDPGTENTVLVRLSQASQTNNQVLVCQVLDVKLPSGRWNHLAVNCRHRLSALNRSVKIQLIINGYQSVDVELKIPPSPARRLGNVHSHLLLGMACVEQVSRPKWHLGHVTLYKREMLTNELAVLLYALGPDGGVFLTSCQDGQSKPNFPFVLRPKLLDRIADWSKVFDYEKLTELLQSSLLLAFSAHKADAVFIYPSIISPTAGIFGSILPGNWGFSAISNDPRSSQQPPIALPVVSCAPVSAHYHLGIKTAIRQLGGYPVLLFLYAHSVDRGPVECQPLALEILFQWLRYDAEEARLFREKKCHWMLRHAFETERCRPGTRHAAVLLNLNCSSPVVVKHPERCNAVICDPEILAFTLRCWKNWQAGDESIRPVFGSGTSFATESVDFGCRPIANHSSLKIEPGMQPKIEFGPVKRSEAARPAGHRLSIGSGTVEQRENALDLVLKTLQNLIRDDHPHRDFNVSQMERAGVLELLLHMARESALFEECVPLTDQQSTLTADLIEGLIGSPPNLRSLTSVVEFLLLLHPAEETYCAGHSEDHAYFFQLASDEQGAFSSRQWKLPDGYETRATEESHQPMNANRLGTALRDVIIKWSDSDVNRLDSPRAVKTADSSSLSLHLIRILVNCVRVMPDSQVRTVFEVVRPDLLVVVGRNKSDKMRALVIRLLNALLERSEEEQMIFMKNGGMLLLANQLEPYPSTPCVVEACLGLCTGIDVVLEQVTDPFLIWPENPSPFQLQSIILLMSLLPNSALDPALFHQLATLLRTLGTRSNQILRILLDFGLIEIVGKSIVAVAHAAKHSGDVLEQREDEILLEGVQRLLLLVTHRLISASGNAVWALFQEMIQLFHFMERVEANSCGEKGRCVRLLRESCCVVLKQAVQTLQHRLEFQQNGKHGLFSLQPGTSHFQLISDKTVGQVVPGTLNRKLKLDKVVGGSEILERFRFLLAKSVDHVTLNVEAALSNIEMLFSRDLLVLMVRAMSSNLERPKSNGAWNISSGDDSVDWSHYQAPESGEALRSLYWNSRQVLRTQLNRLLLYLASPLQDQSVIHFVVKTLHDDPHHEELLKLIPSNELDFTYTLDSYFFHYLHSRTSDDNVEHSTLIKIHCISRILVPPTSSQRRSRMFRLLDPSRVREQLMNERNAWFKTQEEVQLKLLARYDVLTRQVAETASMWTSLAVESQHEIKRKFLKKLKSSHGNKIQAVSGWIELVAQLTHPKSVWHFAKSYPRGWQLDATEGHQRTRLRLERSHLAIDPKYLLQRSKHLIEPENFPQPLESIVRGNLKNVEEALDGEKVLKAINCWVVNTTEETAGELVLTELWLTFVSSEADIERVKYEDVREMHTRRFLLRERALELFLVDNRTLFFVFSATEERDSIVQLLGELCLKLIPPENPADVTQLWRENQITNFEYLVYLNKLAGRSYNDLMQYPIFPFVLSDYESQVLDLNDPHVYRNFKKPMAVQNDFRDQHYIENYNYLKRDYENRPENGSGPNFGPFHYGSLYSNPGIVLHFLVRLPPFTKLLMEYQDRNFDVPDRSFHSVGTSWRLASSDSTTDVKELIPEFFFLPEFLVNSLGFNFGMQQSGDPVDDVQLPTWSRGKPRFFVQIHRQALESSWVRDHLHHWIDLIFGYKQSGPAAIEAINVFHPSTYSGFDFEQHPNDDPIEKSAKLTMIRTYGQVPRQLFRLPHPMNVQPLNGQSVRKSKSLLNSVDNLQWGCYVGSPSCQDPVLKHKESFNSPVHSFLPLRTGDTYALGPFSAAVLAHSYDKDSFLGRPTGILGAALVLWGQSDGIVRIKIRKDEPCKPLLMSRVHDSVVTCATAPDYSRLWVGYRSGLVRVFPFSFDPLRPHFELTAPPNLLTGHVGPIRQLCLCPSFSLAASTGTDGCVILWDLYKLTFIRQFTPGVLSDGKKILPVAQLAVNRNTADVASAVHLDEQHSRLELRSVNGVPVGSTTTESLITSLCFSSAPEGVSINVVAAGLSNGRIRLWDTWTLTLIREIVTDSALPIVSLAYSSTSQHLLAARNDGCLLAWESPHSNKKSLRYPPFINLTLQ